MRCCDGTAFLAVEGDIESVHYKNTWEVEAIDDIVSDPAGTFQNCIRIRQLTEMTQSGSTTSILCKSWLAPDIGPAMYNKYHPDGSWV